MYRSVHHVLELLDARWRPMNTVYSEIYVCVIVRISSRKWSKCKIPRGKLSTFASLLTMKAWSNFISRITDTQYARYVYSTRRPSSCSYSNGDERMVQINRTESLVLRLRVVH